MSLSTILSKLSRLGLLSVFCAGLFIASGELSVNPAGNVQMGSMGVQSVMAADDTAKKDTTSVVINGLADLSNIVIKLLSIFLTPLIMLSGWLLSPDWTFGDIFGLRPIIHNLWILVSNVVYVIFGFMLVFVAFANIFGGENAKTYEMKTMLPKLVTGMLIVPFTWFIVNAVLSVANVLTASVIQLPVSTINMAGGDEMKKFFDQNKIIPKEIILDLTSSGAENKPTNCKDNQDKCYSISEVLGDANGGAYNLLSVYAYGIFHVDKYMDITQNQITSKTVEAVVDIVKKLGFGIVFFVVFGVLVIAIVYALFTRAIMLWMYAIFSPLFALNYVLGDKAKKLEKFTIKEFISLALVPVYVSAALAFGLMFLSLVMNKSGYTKTGMVAKVGGPEITGKTGQQTFQIGGDKGVKLITKGDFNLVDVISDSFETGQGLIGSVIMGFLGLVVLWMAVMAALGASKITEAAVAPIQSMGTKVGELAKSAPQYMPLPIPGAKGQSMKSMSQGVGLITNKFESDANTKAQEFSAPFVDKHYAENAKGWANVSRALSINPMETAKALREQLHGKTSTELAGNDIHRQGIKKVVEKYTIKDVDVNKLSDPTEMANALLKINKYMKEKGLVTEGILGASITSIDGGIVIADAGLKTISAPESTSTTTTPPVIKQPTILPTNITVEGMTPISIVTTNGVKTITQAQFKSIETASGMTKDDLETQLKNSNITIK